MYIAYLSYFNFAIVKSALLAVPKHWHGTKVGVGQPGSLVIQLIKLLCFVTFSTSLAG